jgi:hypothetical protein
VGEAGGELPRFENVETEHLRAEIARLELLRRDEPSVWQAMESLIRSFASNHELRITALEKRVGIRE